MLKENCVISSLKNIVDMFSYYIAMSAVPFLEFNRDYMKKEKIKSIMWCEYCNSLLEDSVISIKRCKDVKYSSSIDKNYGRDDMLKLEGIISDGNNIFEYLANLSESDFKRIFIPNFIKENEEKTFIYHKNFSNKFFKTIQNKENNSDEAFRNIIAIEINKIKALYEVLSDKCTKESNSIYDCYTFEKDIDLENTYDPLSVARILVSLDQFFSYVSALRMAYFLEIHKIDKKEVINFSMERVLLLKKGHNRFIYTPFCYSEKLNNYINEYLEKIMVPQDNDALYKIWDVYCTKINSLWEVFELVFGKKQKLESRIK